MARKAIKRSGKLVLAGSRNPRMQREPKRAWTKEKEREFLAVLSETCNVTRSCEAVGMSVRGANKRRERNAGFRAAWLEAIATAYHRLELALLDRSLNGTEKILRRSNGTEDRTIEYPNQLGLSLLKMHRATVVEHGAATSMEAEDVEQLRERFLRKLERLEQRREREQAQQGE